ncbi:hypothetical protein J7J50_02735 [Lysobacter sp. ISL-50]|nr:hypothetical protein [Lysobacter sp. ISL-50]MBT2775383.1 hypothetical protein [Lysobacter sp. ISL-54]MBT2783506.1 hypothetical protein [Lysobacter sp. ISL-52]
MTGVWQLLWFRASGGREEGRKDVAHRPPGQ